MIVKILSSASKDFHGVKYNDNKINAEKGELMEMKNFPSFINRESSQEDVRNYLKAISKNEKVTKPQFHAVISTKFQEHSKEELTKVAEDFMNEMGYGKQPYIVVFHSDTENNHVHIVSTRVNKDNGKKINDSFEKLKSQKALMNALEKNFGIDWNKRLDKLLKYRFSTISQLEKLLERNGLSSFKNTKGGLTVLKNGVEIKSLTEKQINLQSVHRDKRAIQIKGILEKYKEMYSNKVFKVIDDRKEQGLKQEGQHTENILPKIDFESELQHKLKNIFGIDIVFHFKDDKQPFGYTLIDNASQTIYKGSDIMKMNELFEFNTNSTIHKKEFEQLKNYNIRTEEERQILLKHFNQKGNNFQGFMLFENKSAKFRNAEFSKVKEDVKNLIYKNTDVPVVLQKNENGDWYAIHEQYHHIHKLEMLIGKTAYQTFLNGGIENKQQAEPSSTIDIGKAIKEVANAILDTTENILKPSQAGGGLEDEFKKKRKKRKL